jgi:hypothetical protein
LKNSFYYSLDQKTPVRKSGELKEDKYCKMFWIKVVFQKMTTTAFRVLNLKHCTPKIL